MADIVPNVVIGMPSQLFTLARSFKAASNGKIYIGKIDTDPTIPSNQIQVYVANEDGSTVPVAQPILINAGGYPVYLGQISKFVTVEGHSMAIYDAYMVQQFYFPNVLKYDPDQFSQLLSSSGGDKLVGSSYGGTVYSDYQLSDLKKAGNFGSTSTVSNNMQAIHYADDGMWYVSASSSFPASVPSQPDANWICVGLLNGNPINNLKNWVTDASEGNALATTGIINLMIPSLIKLNIFSCHLNEFSEVHVNGTINSLNGMKFIGNGFYTNPIIYHGTGSAITYSEQIYLENIYIKGDSNWSGSALVCSGHQSYISFRDVNIEGFRYGNIARYSLWISQSNLRMRNVACGFRFLRNSSATDKNDPIATGAWNTSGGWFHNVLDLSGVVIDGCEVGMWGSPMCAVMNAPTVQNVSARGVAGANLVLPDGIEPCAMYLQGGNTTTSTVSPQNWSLQINQLYMETANAGVLVEGYRLCKISMFVQGGTSSARMKFAVKATSGSNVIVSECVGQDFFDSFFIAERQSSIEVQRRVGPMAGTFASGDATSLITYKEQDKLYSLSAAAGLSGRKFLIGPVVNGMYELEVQGVEDGVSMVGGVFDVSIRGGGVWASTYVPLQPLALIPATPTYPDGKTSTPISLDVSSGNLYLVVKTVKKYDARILLRNKLIWGNSIAITIPDSPA